MRGIFISFCFEKKIGPFGPPVIFGLTSLHLNGKAYTFKNKCAVNTSFISYGIAKHHCTFECHMIDSKAKAPTPKAYLNTLKFIHAALLIGVLLFTTFIYATGEGFLIDFTKDNNVFVYLVPTIAMLSYFISNYVFGKQLKDLTKLNSLKSKLMLYLQACVVRYAFIEGAAILSTIAYRLNNHIFYLVISLLLILYLFKLRPTKNKVINDLELKLKDQHFFQKENEEIK
ncbi:hypothetical protein [Arenibacter echinorum]|uniref:Uncharacterized protein n=1 Tax=Arenibacter echinorum TaxID=440515 RepID=A0A327QUF6_9FLAO|nr:hypothetical protein [Arenibacter echinorum]RAJ07043.1 hypothetical protein LV92_03945 [Arenibacter echinorum]